jgi:hypothetical protein
MSEWIFSVWGLPYVISSLIAIALSWSILRKNRNSPMHQEFAVFGLTSSFYLIASFLMMSSPDQDLALKLAIVSENLYFISIGFLAYFACSLAGIKEGDWRVLIAPLLVTIPSLFLSRDARLTDFGWVVTAHPAVTIEGILTFVYLASYSLLIGWAFFGLTKKAKAPWLSRKYGLMLIGFVLFEVVGVVVSNSLMLVFSNIPHFGGILYFLSLVSIWYGLTMERPREVSLTQMGGEFSDAYRNFINRFLDVAPSDELGLKTVNLLEYLDKTRLSEFITYDRLRIILNVEKLDQLDNIQALDKTMEYLESKDWSDKLAGPFTEVLEGVYTSVSLDQEKVEAFKAVVANHQAFLMRTDVIYAFSKGQFLELLGSDSSLSSHPEWEVSLRIYKRWLLPIRKFITGPIAAEFYKKVRSMDLVKYLDVSQGGEITTDKLTPHLEAIPEERRASVVRGAFDPLMSWIAQTLVASDPTSFTKWMKTIRRVAIMNGDAKGTWGTFASLASRLSKDLGRDRVKDLVLLEGSSPDQLNVFAGAFGLDHGKLLHEKTLIEYDPRFMYEALISQAIEEISANTERCVVFTRRGSAIHRMAASVENCEVVILATPGARGAASVPFNDITRIINATGKAMESELETWILFDNLSDLVFSTSFEQAYVFARHVTDIIASKNGSALFLLNKTAHNQETKSAFESLFSTIVEIDEATKLVKR